MIRIILMSCTILLGMSAGQAKQQPEPIIVMNEREFRITPDMLPPADRGARHDSTYLDSVIRYRMAWFHIPGAQTLAIKNGQIIWNMPFGYAYVQDSIEVADTTLFTMASISKTMVAWAVMQLWEQGVIGLDDNVNDYLPFQVIHPLYPDSIITIRMLMAHTAGLRDAWSVILGWTSYGQDSPIPLGQLLQDYFVPGGLYYNADSNFYPYPPCAAWNYCNMGTTLLAYVAEYMADSFPIYTRDSIFYPLSMNKTTWFLSELDTMNLAMPYHWNGSNYVPYGHFSLPFYPAGFLRTSAPQLARSLQAFMQHGQIDSVRLLDSTTVETMTTVQYPALDTTQGLIWYRMGLWGRDIWGHSGGYYGICTFQFYCPAENSGVIVFTNIDAYGQGRYAICLIADEIFDYAAEYGIVEEKSGTIGSQTCFYVSPSPFRNKTTIHYVLSTMHSASGIGIKIYNSTGQLVKSFTLSTMPSALSISWQGDDDSGKKLPSGVYFVTLSAGNRTETKKVMLVR